MEETGRDSQRPNAGQMISGVGGKSKRTSATRVWGVPLKVLAKDCLLSMHINSYTFFKKCFKGTLFAGRNVLKVARP